ncbi:MAG: 4Fe-4S binding protein [Deltaproteobacteria bacterium]|nr:4Fe-4S binding protein [Deltaproteobacteria bacterium]
MVPTIDAFKCDGCKICVLQCPPQIMGIVKNVAVIITDLCEECGICNDVCPIGAVRFHLPEREYTADHPAYHAHPR